MREKIRAYFAEHKQEVRDLIIEITRRLVEVRTVNVAKADLGKYPYLKAAGQETLACNIVKEYFDKWGVECSIVEGAPMRGNVLARYGKGRPELMFGLHMDVVPPGDEAKWTTPPFEVHEYDGRLRGRGVLDNKGPMASTMAAVWLLKSAGVELKGTVLVAGLASEEFREPGVQDPGIEFLLEKGLLKPDMAVIPDIGEQMKVIDVAEKGRAGYRICTTGVQAHGSTPERGINAVNMMARVLAALEKLELVYERHPVLGAPSRNVGIVNGGTAANLVPAECTAIVDVRFVPGQTAEGIRREIEAVAREAVAEYGAGSSVDVTIDVSVGPHAMPADHDLVKAIQASTSKVLGFEPQPIGIGGGTFAKSFNLGGIPAVGFGPGEDEQFHVVNESIDVDELVQFAELASLVACDLLR